MDEKKKYGKKKKGKKKKPNRFKSIEELREYGKGVDQYEGQ